MHTILHTHLCPPLFRINLRNSNVAHLLDLLLPPAIHIHNAIHSRIYNTYKKKFWRYISDLPKKKIFLLSFVSWGDCFPWESTVLLCCKTRNELVLPIFRVRAEWKWYIATLVLTSLLSVGELSFLKLNCLSGNYHFWSMLNCAFAKNLNSCLTFVQIFLSHSQGASHLKEKIFAKKKLLKKRKYSKDLRGWREIY